MTKSNNINNVKHPIIRTKSLRNGSVTKNNKSYIRTYDLSRYSNDQLVNALYSKKWNTNRRRFIADIYYLLDERIAAGKCTKYEIDNLKYLANIKKHNIVKSVNNNSRTTTTNTTIPVSNSLVSLKYRINSLSNEIFRITGARFKKLNRTDDVSDKAHVFYDQIFASLHCIHNMLMAKDNYKHSRYNMLTAETQAGKTGVVRNVIFLLETYPKLREYLGLEFGGSVIITPMCDNANKEQLKTDISHGECRQDNQKLLKSKGIMHNPDMLSWSRNNQYGNLHDCIIFVDESHLASGVSGAMNSYLQKNNINLNGSTNLSKNNIFLFTISATPYEEHVGNLLFKKKNTIELAHGPNYKGLDYFLKNNFFRQSFDLSTTEGENHFKNEVESFNHKIGYYIVRINISTDTDNLIPEGFSTLTYFEKDKEVINETLRKIPDTPTLIFVKEKMKQSYQLDKQNIVMMFDRSVVHDSDYRTSFIVQSFAGRFCGYHNYNAIIYTEINDVKLHLDYLKNKNHVPHCKRVNNDKKFSFKEKNKSQQSSYSNKNDLSYANNFTLKIGYKTQNDGYITLNNNIITIYLDNKRNLVLSKKSKVETEFLSSYIEDYVVCSDIKTPCNSFLDAKNALESYCKIVSSKTKIDDVKTKNGKKFIELLEFNF